ncbi:MAG: EamA family transporter [Eubacteriales bacterium]|nr:EamA family transporter [Eubacteriales bacterium]
MFKNQSVFGAFCGLMTGICWGVSGVFGQFLFETRGIETTWLVPIRLTTAGILMLVYLFATKREETIALMKNKRDFLQTILAGVFGTMMFQFTFFGTVQRSNAGTATVLQYLAPVMIMIYVCVRKKKIPKKLEALSIFLALAGIFLISTHGNVNELVMTPEALLWGIGCAFFMFLNTVLPESLYTRHASTVVVGWALLFGGIVLSLIFKPWKYDIHIDPAVIISLFFIIIGGSVAAYLFYANSVKRIGPTKASLFSCIEPVTATILSALWLKTNFMWIDLIGFALILSTIFILSKTGE